MSSVCLTCDGKINKLPSNCVFTAQGDIECFHKGTSPEKEMVAATRVVSTAAPGTPAALVYPVRGIDSEGYYRYISELSGEPIQNRYIETIPAEETNSCAVKHTQKPIHHKDNNVVGIPEWGPHASWLSLKDAQILKDPIFNEHAVTQNLTA